MHPNQLADLLLSGSVLRGATLATIDPPDEDFGTTALVTLERGADALTSFSLEPDFASATVARIALIAGLELGGDGERMRRFSVKIGDDPADLIAAVRATPNGLALELRPLSFAGLPLSVERSHALGRCPHCERLYPSQVRNCEVDGEGLAPVHDDPQPGGFIGPYRLDERAGIGGMGVVYLGTHALIGRPVAVKVLHETLLEDPSLVGRFLLEARAASKLDHPGIVDVTDFGVLGDGRPYVVMERLAGEPLFDRMSRARGLDPLESVRIVREVALALAHAHAHGVVHQDIKPANVFLLAGSTDERPLVKLIDFGAAQAMNTSTPEGENVLGTPAYMAPEHARGLATDARSDIYALGVVLYEMLAGAPPFMAKEPMEILKMHVFKEAPVVKVPYGKLPRAVEACVMRMLKKKPSDRHADCTELAAELERCIAVLGG